jgi:hypothetical protein
MYCTKYVRYVGKIWPALSCREVRAESHMMGLFMVDLGSSQSRVCLLFSLIIKCLTSFHSTLLKVSHPRMGAVTKFSHYSASTQAMSWRHSSDTKAVLRGKAFLVQANQYTNHRGTAHWARSVWLVQIIESASFCSGIEFRCFFVKHVIPLRMRQTELSWYFSWLGDQITRKHLSFQGNASGLDINSDWLGAGQCHFTKRVRDGSRSKLFG